MLTAHPPSRTEVEKERSYTSSAPQTPSGAQCGCVDDDDDEIQASIIFN
jgi:hypothetical protein